MNGTAGTSAPVPVGPGRIRSRTLTLIRWVAVVGQAGTLVVVHYGLGFSLPIGIALAVVGASALLNLAVTIRKPVSGGFDDRLAARFLAFDICQLAVLLFLTGGLGNPFAFLLLAPVTVSATILSMRSTVALCTLSLACITVLALWHMSLPWGPQALTLPLVYVLGVWAALAVGILFFSAYTWRVAEEARKLSNALSATQLALDREQRVSAVGALAAAVAHELGSPLGTIAIAVREIASELPDDSPIGEDVRLLISETNRCRDILAELALNPQNDGMPFAHLPVHAVVEAAASGHEVPGIRIDFDFGPDARTPTATEPHTHAGAEILHGLGNLVQNAQQFAVVRVVVSTRWGDEDVLVRITDDGPGFPQTVLQRIGEPYFSQRSEKGEHMGLGIFIAQTLLQRTGGSVAFSNLAEGGAEVAVRWSRAALEAQAGEPTADSARRRPGEE
jgi:two-component system sensor histidine kinase RegB